MTLKLDIFAETINNLSDNLVITRKPRARKIQNIM